MKKLAYIPCEQLDFSKFDFSTVKEPTLIKKITDKEEIKKIMAEFHRKNDAGELTYYILSS